MTENKGDLISREALSKSMRKSINERYISWTKTITVADIATLIFDEIDNAPTVEANSIIDGLNNEIDDLSENLAWYINERNRLLKERRPQGEWKTNKSGYVYCSECNTIKMQAFNKFCSFCGADMMRGEEE